MHKKLQQLPLDPISILDIISTNIIKSCEEDEYALHDGIESRRLVEALPETTASNGPPSWQVKIHAGQMPPLQRMNNRARTTPVTGLGYKLVFREQQPCPKKVKLAFPRAYHRGFFY